MSNTPLLLTARIPIGCLLGVASRTTLKSQFSFLNQSEHFSHKHQVIRQLCPSSDAYSGTVFKLDPPHETALHSFTGADGTHPDAVLVRDFSRAYTKAVVCVVELWRDTGAGGAPCDFDVMTPGTSAR